MPNLALTPRVLSSLPLLLLCAACPGKPLPGDDEATSTETGTSTSTSTDTSTETGTDTGTGTGTDTSTDTGTDTGGVDCPPPAEPPDFAFHYTLTIDGEPFMGVLDEACTLDGILPGEALLDISCPSRHLQLAIMAQPALAVDGAVGEALQVWLFRGGFDQFAPLWLRVDFPEQDVSLFVIDGEPLVPPADQFYAPPPWELAVVGDCGPLEDGCATWRPQQIGLDYQDQSLAVWGGSYGAIMAGEGGAELWVARAEEIIELSPACDPAPGFFRTHRMLIRSAGLPVEGDVCQPGESNPCATGLHCCYPCGIPDCDYLCTPEDAFTMECPPPPP